MADRFEIKDYGLVLGSFSPMHTGHLDLIMMAKKVCPKGAIVAVCGLDGDRGTRVGLPIERRYVIIKNIFKDDPLVKVVFMKDNDIGIAGYNNKWKEWLTALAKTIVKELEGVSWKYLLANLTLFTGEETYHHAVETVAVGCRECATWPNDCGPNAYLIPRTINTISATQIRKRPMTFWNEIIGPEFKSYFAKRILIIGTASEGKSTLTRDLARYFDADFSEEYGHEAIDAKTSNREHPDDTQLTLDDYFSFLDVQYKYNTTCNKKLKICDSDAMTTLMYAKYYSMDSRYRITEDDYVKIEEHAKFLNYDVIFVLPPKENSWVQDGCRDCLTNSFEDRQKQYQVLMKILGQHYCTEDVVYLTRDYYDNFIKAKEVISQLLAD